MVCGKQRMICEKKIWKNIHPKPNTRVADLIGRRNKKYFSIVLDRAIPAIHDNPIIYDTDFHITDYRLARPLESWSDFQKEQTRMRFREWDM